MKDSITKPFRRLNQRLSSKPFHNWNRRQEIDVRMHTEFDPERFFRYYLRGGNIPKLSAFSIFPRVSEGTAWKAVAV